MASAEGKMRALVVDPGQEGGLRFGEVSRPVAGPGQVLVQNHNIGINYFDAWSLNTRAPGFVPGWDSAGVVVRAAQNEDGPKEGARVAGLDHGQGGWAEFRVLNIADLAIVPDGVDLASAAGLPMAGVTALRALRASGSLLGRRVLVTGAAGGVGHLSMQLAALAGADVVGSVGSAARAKVLSGLGLGQVVVGLRASEGTSTSSSTPWAGTRWHPPSRCCAMAASW